jgi:hypothetical protein
LVEELENSVNNSNSEEGVHEVKSGFELDSDKTPKESKERKLYQDTTKEDREICGGLDVSFR